MSMRRTGIGWLLFAAASCQRREGSRQHDTSDSVVVVASGVATMIAGPITEDGFGPLRIGMSVAQARATFPSVVTFPPIAFGQGTTGCTMGTFAGLPEGVSMMVENDTIVRFDVDSGNVATREGARVGDSEERIRSLYGNRVTVLPHKYTDGHYLTVTGALDTLHRIVFETQRGKVTTYRAGKMPQVEYVERCS